MMILWPNGTTTKPTVSSKYGDGRGGGRKHAGTDFVGYTTIHAIADGTVTKVGLHNADAGHAVVIDSVIDGQTVTFCHFHIAAGSGVVTKGQKVKSGQPLATMGSTGNATGKCDHTEIRFWKGTSVTTVDPEIWLGARIKAGLRPGSLVTKEQVDEISGWLARTYDTYQYWHDVQTWGIKIGAYPKAMHDGIPGPLSFKAELAVWNYYIAPKPEPEPTPVEPEPTEPAPVEPSPPAPEPVEPEPVDPEPEPDPVEPDPVDPPAEVEPPADDETGIEPPTDEEQSDDDEPTAPPGKGRIVVGAGVAVGGVILALILQSCGGPAL